jgi:hypothetical protein
VNDCSGTNHDLFSELDAGKVVVICWVMPCSSCVGPALSAQTEIQNSSNPAKINYYIVDDYGTTSCATLTSWCNTNGLTNSNARFSNPAIKMSDYGSSGMPKTVILAGTNHQVFFNENNTLTASSFNAALSSALSAADAVSVNEMTPDAGQLRIFPNPTSDVLILSDVTNEKINATAEIYNACGEKVKRIERTEFDAASSALDIDTSELNNGIYFLNISGRSHKFIVAH